MVPLNTSVTQTGNYVLSDLDVAKINCAYQCEAQGGPCGGSVEVRDQPVDLSGEASDCRWAVHAYGDQEDDDHQQYGLQIVVLEVYRNYWIHLDIKVVCFSFPTAVTEVSTFTTWTRTEGSGVCVMMSCQS